MCGHNAMMSVHRVDYLPISSRLGKERIDEELCKHVQGALEVRVRHVEEIVGVEHIRVLLAAF